jgi:hypothetical protein
MRDIFPTSGGFQQAYGTAASMLAFSRRMRWVDLVCVAAVALVSACSAGADYPTFTAKQYRLEGNRTLPGTEISGPATFYRDGERLRYEGVLNGYGIATVIYDPARNAAYLLQSSPPRRRLFAGAPPRPIASRLNDAEIRQPLEVAWAALGADGARSFGRCRIAGERGVFWRTRQPVAPGIVRTACITPDGIVLQLTENDTVLFRATSLQRGPQTAALFEIPETYQIIDSAELARTDLEPAG